MEIQFSPLLFQEGSIPCRVWNFHFLVLFHTSLHLGSPQRPNSSQEAGLALSTWLLLQTAEEGWRSWSLIARCYFLPSHRHLVWCFKHRIPSSPVQVSVTSFQHDFSLTLYFQWFWFVNICPVAIHCYYILTRVTRRPENEDESWEAGDVSHALWSRSGVLFPECLPSPTVAASMSWLDSKCLSLSSLWLWEEPEVAWGQLWWVR